MPVSEVIHFPAGIFLYTHFSDFPLLIAVFLPCQSIPQCFLVSARICILIFHLTEKFSHLSLFCKFSDLLLDCRLIRFVRQAKLSPFLFSDVHRLKSGQKQICTAKFHMITDKHNLSIGLLCFLCININPLIPLCQTLTRFYLLKRLLAERIIESPDPVKIARRQLCIIIYDQIV
mgnify:CR=1 FL=1